MLLFARNSNLERRPIDEKPVKLTGWRDMDGRKLRFIASAIVKWYEVNARDLPWRREPYKSDPYSIAISEIMLQQTQVKTVVPYFERWMQTLPTVHAFATARPQRVLKLWEGLGYLR